MKKILFGTDGIRGRVGAHPFTKDALPELGNAIGEWAYNKYGKDATLLLAHDTRASCAWIKAALTSGMLLHQLHILDAHTLPTPAGLCLAQTKLPHVSCVVVISASHNPYSDNGIKLIDVATGKLSSHDEELITDLFYADVKTDDKEPDQFGTSAALPQADNLYLEAVYSLFPSNFLHGKTIVLDCAHGATSFIAPKIFTACGAHVITLNDNPNGKNINDQCGALHPEQLQKAVIDAHADAGFAFDGDGDRVIAVNNRGEIKNGDDLITLLSMHPRYKDQRTIVGTIMSNQGFELFLQEHAKRLVRTPVGDKHVVHTMHMENLLLGGEQSGHIILGDYLSTGDGIVAALRTLEAIMHTDNMAMKTFTCYPQVLLNISVRHKKDLHSSPFREIIEEHQAQLSQGRLLVRYSGTEAVLRVMAEAEEHEHAYSAALHLSEHLKRALS